VTFVTNNSTLSRRQYVAKFERFGIAVDEADIFCTAWATATYLRHSRQLAPGSRVYVIGQQGVCDELTAVGLVPHVDSRHSNEIDSFADLDMIKDSPQVSAVVVGFDLHINYQKLARAQYYLRDEQCDFVATNTDSTFPTNGTLFPGTGTIVAAVECASDRKPVVIGKPNQVFMDCITEATGLDPARTCMIGDRLDTDILFGLQAGLATLLVLTGVTKSEDLPHSSITPDHVMASLGDVTRLLQP